MMKSCSQKSEMLVFAKVGLAIALAHCGPIVSNCTAASTQETSPNAALVYWQAFALMPAPCAEEEAVFSEDGAIDFKKHKHAIKGLVGSCGDSLTLLRATEGMNRCDWGLVDNGFSTLLPHLSKARRMTRLALLRAGYYANTGKLDDAVTDVVAVSRLARHLGREFLVELLVQISIENQANVMIRKITPKLDAKTADRLYVEIAKLPKSKTFSDAIRGEAAQVDAEVNRMIDQGELAKLAVVVGNAGGAKHLFELAKGGPKAVRALLKQTLADYEKIAVAGEMEPAKAKVAIKNLEEELAKSKNPFTLMFLPTASRIYERWHESQLKFRETMELLDKQRKK